MWLIAIVAGLLAFDRASKSYCVTCYRPFAVWPMKSEPRRWISVCRRCYRAEANR